MREVKQYRKKPVVIEAVKLKTTPNGWNGDDVADWCGGSYAVEMNPPTHKGSVIIPTLEGEMTAQDGDYIIKGVKGEFYPCKPDIFEATYEPVTTPPIKGSK